MTELKESESICSKCDQKISEDNTYWDYYADPYCKECFRGQDSHEGNNYG